MGDQPEPRWDLVDDPVAFFELSAGFDRKDLKRAYNRLAKRFRPERFPDEFQRIRHAYETLERSLRYGATPMRAPAPVAVVGTGTAAPAAARSVREEVVELLASETAESVVARLRQKDELEPWEYVALAVLSDVVTGDGPGFGGWLARGLCVHPHETMLRQLLFQCCNHPRALAEAATLVEDLARAKLDSMTYGWLTEGLWQHLIRTLRFDDFEVLYSRCARQQRGRGPTGRALLTLSLLRVGILVAADDWVDGQLELLEGAAQHLPPGLDDDLETLFALNEYRRARAEFLDGNAERQAIDEVLVALTDIDVVRADAAFYAWQHRARNRTEELLEAFPLDDDTGGAPPVEALFQCAGIVFARTRENAPEFDYGRMQQVVHEHVFALERRGGRLRYAYRWFLHRCLGLFTAVVLLPGAFMAGALMLGPEGMQSDGAVIGLTFGALSTWVVSSALILRFWMRPAQRAYVRRCYELFGRREIARFLAETRYAFGDFAAMFTRLQETRLRVQLWDLIREDRALAIQSVAWA